MSTLLLRFSGRQSWGAPATFAVYPTEKVPTRSGIEGLLACGLGVFRKFDPRIDATRMTDFPEWFPELSITVRADRFGAPLEDFHLITRQHRKVLGSRGFWKGLEITADSVDFEDIENKNKTENRTKLSSVKFDPVSNHTVLTPAGVKWIGENAISRRHYLSDAEFMVAISHPDDRITDQLLQSVSNPVFATYLGRKACLPRFPFVLGVSDLGADQLLTDLPTTRRNQKLRKLLSQAPSDSLTGFDDDTDELDPMGAIQRVTASNRKPEQASLSVHRITSNINPTSGSVQVPVVKDTKEQLAWVSPRLSR
ncbi:CRISPR-associated protein Cas5 [Nakamurella antarctica]|uniref:CRISPR-associated protein Cas5 n=1 Tax=Nakamurella antarctica TaxID=1902245 RepID=UPI0013DE1275|nr:CRISPR-associated protein Cas5 [Nakamurella antarctica]